MRMILDLAIPLSYLATYSAAILRAILMLATSRHSEYFLSCVFHRIDREQKHFVCVFPSVCIYPSVIVYFNDIDHEYFWVRIISVD
jgi:hypothetical protein